MAPGLSPDDHLSPTFLSAQQTMLLLLLSVLAAVRGPMAVEAEAAAAGSTPRVPLLGR